MEELLLVQVHPMDHAKTVRIEAMNPKDAHENFKAFLQRNADIFAWSHEDMPNIDPHLIAHRLNINLNYCPVK